MTPKQLAALAALAAGGLVLTWTVTGGSKVVEAQCAMPKCGADKKKPVDCLVGGPYTKDGGPQWLGCGVYPTRFLVGTECIPAPCVIRAGSKLEVNFLGTEAREVDKQGNELPEYTKEDGGSFVDYKKADGGKYEK